MSTSLRFNQRILFASIFIGYGFYILCRKSFSFVIPNVQHQENLSKEDLGTIISSMNLAYALSKFVLGILSDHISARLLFCSGLFSTALAVVGFSQSSNVSTFAYLWFLNGLAQGCGWPACSKLLRKWFRKEEFGTYWSVLAASNNVTGALVPFILPFLLLFSNGWRGFILISGIISIIWSLICLFSIHECPEDIGLPPVLVVNDQQAKSKKDDDAATDSPKSGFGDLLRSPYLHLLSFYYFVVFAAKTSCENWAQLLIVDEKQLPASTASQFVSAFETGGFVASFATGYLTDIFVQKFPTSKGGSPRMILVLFYMVLSTAALFLLTNFNGFLPVVAFILGSSLYGCINIFGIVATEAAPMHLSGTSHAIVSLAANIGAVLAGYPFSVLAHWYGWTSVFVLLEAFCGLCFFLMILTRNVSGKIGQKQE